MCLLNLRSVVFEKCFGVEERVCFTFFFLCRHTHGAHAWTYVRTRARTHARTLETHLHLFVCVCVCSVFSNALEEEIHAKEVQLQREKEIICARFV